MSASASGDLGGSRAERRRRWWSFDEVIGWSCWAFEGLIGGRSDDIDHVGFERSASTSM